jgi:uncharacterized protein YcgI (DUF1989 family)
VLGVGLLFSCGPNPDSVVEGRSDQSATQAVASSPMDGTGALFIPAGMPADATVSSGEIKDTVYFLGRLMDLSALAKRYPSEKLVMQGYPSRETIALATETIAGKTWQVLLDAQGPGCLVRFWTRANTAGTLRIYLDNQPTPTVEMPVQDFFSGNHFPFFKPLVFNNETMGAGGMISYFPIPFATHCKMVCDASLETLAYEATVRQFAPDEPVQTFDPTPSPQLGAVLEKYKTHFGIQPLNELIQQAQNKPMVTIPAGTRQMVVHLSGPAAIDYLAFQLSDYTPLVMDQIQLEIYWDRQLEPAVACSLLDFFDTRGTDQSWNLYALGQFKDNPETDAQEFHALFSRFYMPYREKAQIFIHNHTENPIEVGLQYHLKTRRLPEDFLYFHAQSQKRSLQMGFTYPLFHFTGQGNFVGVKLYTFADSFPEEFFYLQGAPSFYCDGEATPSLTNAQTDAFFNMDAEAFGAGYFWCQFFGCLGKQSLQGGFSNLVRTLFLDSIPFQSSLLWVQEMGDPSRIEAFPLEKPAFAFNNYTCFWYGDPAVTPSKPREEQVYYYTVTASETDMPTLAHPVIQGSMVHLNLPQGVWWLHTAPIWDINRVSHQKREIP